MRGLPCKLSRVSEAESGGDGAAAGGGDGDTEGGGDGVAAGGGDGEAEGSGDGEVDGESEDEVCGEGDCRGGEGGRRGDGGATMHVHVGQPSASTILPWTQKMVQIGPQTGSLVDRLVGPAPVDLAPMAAARAVATHRMTARASTLNLLLLCCTATA